LSAAGATKDQKEDSNVYPNHPKQKKERNERTKGSVFKQFENRRSMEQKVVRKTTLEIKKHTTNQIR
jgi:hypothetical protein